MSKRGAVVLIAIMAFVFGAFGSIFHLIAVEDAKQTQREREWVSYSEKHQCRIVRNQSFWEPSELWECSGGFQVRRYPR